MSSVGTGNHQIPMTPTSTTSSTNSDDCVKSGSPNNQSTASGVSVIMITEEYNTVSYLSHYLILGKLSPQTFSFQCLIACMQENYKS